MGYEQEIRRVIYSLRLFVGSSTCSTNKSMPQWLKFNFNQQWAIKKVNTLEENPCSLWGLLSGQRTIKKVYTLRDFGLLIRFGLDRRMLAATRNFVFSSMSNWQNCQFGKEHHHEKYHTSFSDTVLIKYWCNLASLKLWNKQIISVPLHSPTFVIKWCKWCKWFSP